MTLTFSFEPDDECLRDYQSRHVKIRRNEIVVIRWVLRW